MFQSMFESARRFLVKNQPQFLPEPDLHEVEDMTGKGLTMDYMIGALIGEGGKPKAGDVIIWIESDGMGMTVARDRRARVLDGVLMNQNVRLRLNPHHSAPIYQMQARMEDGTLEWFIVNDLHRCGLAARTWVYTK